MGTDELWGSVAARIQASCGWSLRPLTQLGTPREGRRTWLAEPVGGGGPGRAIVKASANPFAPSRAAWAASAMGLLGKRGYPVPALLWRGPLDDRWFLVVQARLPGHPLGTLDAPTLDALLALVELQADQGHGLGEGGWDISWWIGVVLFEGWEHWWDAAHLVAPRAGRRLRTFLQSAWGHRLPAADLVHGDLNLTNVLAEHGVITGVVDWDDLGVGCRAVDLAGLLFDWQRLRLAGSRGWRRTVRSGWWAGSSRSPATKACTASSPMVRSPGSDWPPSATSPTPCGPGVMSSRHCSTPCNDQCPGGHMDVSGEVVDRACLPHILA